MRVINHPFYTYNNNKPSLSDKTSAYKKYSSGVAYPKLYSDYYTHFCGIKTKNDYNNDLLLLNKYNQMLDITVNNVSSYYSGKYSSGSMLVKALNTTKKERPGLYNSIITAKPEQYKLIEQKFNEFEDITLNSLDKVRSGKAKYTDFWLKNKNINGKPVKDIISLVTDNSGGDVNKNIQKMGNKNFQKLKDEMTIEWFREQLNTNNDKRYEQEYRELKSLYGDREADNLVSMETSNLSNLFDKNTADKIFESKDSDSKIVGFQNILNHVEHSLISNNNKTNNNTIKIIIKSKEALLEAQDKENFDNAESAIMDLYKIAKEDWINHDLKNGLINFMEKKNFIKKVENKDSRIELLEGYENFNTDKKYFIVKYFDNKRYDETKQEYEFNPTNDPLLKIINDRTMDYTFDNSFESMGQIINQKKNENAANLDTIYDISRMRKDKQTNPYSMEYDINGSVKKLEYPYRENFSPDDKRDYVDLIYAKIAGASANNNLADIKSKKEKESVLLDLTEDEQNLINKSLIQDFDTFDTKYLMKSIVRQQAQKTDSRNKMLGKLEQINDNIVNVKIAIDNQTHSIKDLFESRIQLSSGISDADLLNRLDKKFEDCSDMYNRLSPEKQKEVDNTLSKELPQVIEAVVAKDKSEKSLKLLELGQGIKRNNYRSSNRILSQMRNSLMISYSRDLCHSHAHAASHLAAYYPLPTAAGAASAGSTGGQCLGMDPSMLAVIACLMVAERVVKDVDKIKTANLQSRDLIFTLD